MVMRGEQRVADLALALEKETLRGSESCSTAGLKRFLASFD